MKRKFLLLICLFTLFICQPVYAENWLYATCTDDHYYYYNADFTTFLNGYFYIMTKTEIRTPPKDSNLKYSTQINKVTPNKIYETSNIHFYNKNNQLIYSDYQTFDTRIAPGSPIDISFSKAIERYWRQNNPESVITINVLPADISDKNKKVTPDDIIEKQEEKKESKQPPNLSWEGIWRHSYGEIHLKQTGNKIEGIIKGERNDKAGRFSGTIEGNKIVGKWSKIRFLSSLEPNGEFEFTMSANGKNIAIRWR